MEHHLRIAESLAFLLDNRFALGKFRFGLDPVIGLVPGLGNIAGLLLSFYLVWIAIRMRVPEEKLREMVKIIITDFIIGIIPVIGKFGDFIYKANSKNVRIIREHAPRIVEARVIT